MEDHSLQTHSGRAQSHPVFPERQEPHSAVHIGCCQSEACLWRTGASALRRSEEITWLAFWIWFWGLIADPQLFMAGMRPKRRETSLKLNRTFL